MITRAFLWIRRCFETSLNKGHFVKVITKIHDMVEACNTIPRPLGLVPTMGALPRGHEALFRQARHNNASVAVSIFVNPSQFNKKADFKSTIYSSIFSLNYYKGFSVICSNNNIETGEIIFNFICTIMRMYHNATNVYIIRLSQHHVCWFV